ncbi:MAG TPA: hypothetical protein VNV16_14950 [Methylibium sp.]|nr:hypothetical protein [Methylibium sp.]
MHYVVTATLRLPAGSVVGLSDAQAARRKHMLVPVAKRKGWYAASLDLCFKVGEAIQYEGELPKALASAVEAPKRAGKPAGSDKPPAGTGKPAGSEGDDADGEVQSA